MSLKISYERRTNVDWKERLKIEQQELQQKIDKLTDFWYKAAAEKTLTEDELDLLNIQLDAMLIYNSVLKRRIKLYQ